MANLISFSFNSLTPKNMGNFANNVVQQMSADTQFVSLKADVESLKLLHESFWAAFNDAQKGGSDRIALRNTRQEPMRAQLYKVALLVEILANGNPDVIKAAGFELRKTTKTPSPTVTTPTNLLAAKGDKIGSIALTWKGSAGSTSYDIQCRLVGETVWINSKHTTQQSVIIYGFELGKEVEFRIAANGVGETESDWSDPIRVWPTNV